MFGRTVFSDMRNDPFFSHHNSMMAEMDRMMGDFNRSFGMPMFPAIGDVPSTGDRNRSIRQRNEITPFGGTSMFDSMFGNMESMMAEMRNNPSTHSYSSTKVFSYSNTGQGEPKYYEATSETTQGPGGVRQTRKSERNSQTGLDRMAVGHHIYDRGHVTERIRNRRTNEREEKQEFFNMDEGDKDAFQREWQEKTRSFPRSIGADRHGHHRREQRAIDSREYNRGRYNRRRRDDSSDSDNDRHDGRHVRINSRPEEI